MADAVLVQMGGLEPPYQGILGDGSVIIDTQAAWCDSGHTTIDSVQAPFLKKRAVSTGLWPKNV